MIIVCTAVLHAWALRAGMPDVAHFVASLGALTLAGLAMLACLLRQWAWAFALGSLTLALLMVFTYTTFFY